MRFVALATQVATELASVNLIQNGDIEQTASDGTPFHWQSRTAGLSDVTHSVAHGEGYNGGNALKIESSHSEDRPWFNWFQTFESPNHSIRCRIKCRLKTEVIERGAALVLSYQDQNNELRRQQIAVMEKAVITFSILTQRSRNQAGS